MFIQFNSIHNSYLINRKRATGIIIHHCCESHLETVGTKLYQPSREFFIRFKGLSVSNIDHGKNFA